MEEDNRNMNNISSRPVTETPEASIFIFLLIFMRRKGSILAIFLLALVFGIFFSLRPRKYSADGSIRIQSGTASMYRTNPISALSGDSSDKIASEVAILQSRTLYLQVAKELDLQNIPAFTGKKASTKYTLDDPWISEEIVKEMRKAIQIQHNPKDELIYLTATTTSPTLSAKIVDALINDYVGYLFKMRFGASQRTSKWLLGQLDDLRQQIERDQTAITELQAKLGVIGFDEKDSDYLSAQSLNAFTKAASDATISRIVAEAKFRFLQESDPNLVEGEVGLLNSNPSASPNGLLQNLRNTQAQLSSNYSRMRAQLGLNYPDVIQQRAQLDEINRQVKAEESRILNQAKLSFSAASENERMTQQTLASQREETFRSRSDMVKYVILLHDYQSHRSLYEGLVLRLREAGITSGLEAGEIDVVDLAALPVRPNAPGPFYIMVTSAIVGLLLGAFAALGMDLLDMRIKTTEQAQQATQMPLLAEIPHIKGANNYTQRQDPIGVISAPQSRYAEAVQNLRTSLLLARPGAPPKTILVTSAIPSEGKSTTSLNLAAILQRHKPRVLLIDCDLRRGDLAGRLGLNPAKGLSNVLTGQFSFDEAVQTAPGSQGLKLLVSGTRPPDPAELIASNEMLQLIQHCMSNFDFVILDSPPVLGLSDALNLARCSDGVIFIVRNGFTWKQAVKRAATQLRSTGRPIIGFALNDVSQQEYGSGYGNYYGYYTEP
jgi:succinoglycan biosynthesis transport protein ExoP